MQRIVLGHGRTAAGYLNLDLCLLDRDGIVTEPAIGCQLRDS